MDVLHLKKLFPDLEEGLYNEILKHGTIKELKAGKTILKMSQTIRSAMLILDGLVKLYREDDEDMNERLEAYIMKQVARLGHNLKMTHQNIATDLNYSREVLSRLLKKREAKGWVVT